MDTLHAAIERIRDVEELTACVNAILQKYLFDDTTYVENEETFRQWIRKCPSSRIFFKDRSNPKFGSTISVEIQPPRRKGDHLYDVVFRMVRQKNGEYTSLIYYPELRFSAGCKEVECLACYIAHLAIHVAGVDVSCYETGENIFSDSRKIFECTGISEC